MDVGHQVDWMMVVEDQGDIWRILNGALKRALPDVPTRHAANGPTALSHLQACLVDQRLLPRMILMDLYMPNVEDGLALLNTLKAPDSRLSHLPVVVMSSSTNPLDRQQVTGRNVSFLVKPLFYTDWDTFLDTVHQYWDDSTTIGRS
ncbi:response regulator [Spirosoma aerophilum]